jgi:uncharacterized protein
MREKLIPFNGLMHVCGRHPVLTAPGTADTLARLMSGLPQFFAPIRLAERGEAIVGDITVSQMPRLRQSLHDGSGTVHVSISCEPGESGTIRIRGRVSTLLKLECQRCLEAFELPLHLSIDASAAPSGAGSGIEADVLMQGEDNMVHLAGFVEDELILALPLAPLHAPGQCPVAEYTGNAKATRDNPFAVLRRLRPGKGTPSPDRT